MAITAAFFADADYQDQLVRLLCTDPLALAACAAVVTSEDFSPLPGVADGHPRWVVATRALDYWEKYHSPIRQLLRSDTHSYAERIHLGKRQQQNLEQYLQHLANIRCTNPDAVTEQVVTYKIQRKRAQIIEQMAQLHGAGQLDDEQWAELATQGQHTEHRPDAKDYFDAQEMEARIERRLLHKRESSAHYFLIEPLDAIVQGIGPGHLGLVIGPTKRGKSLCLIWIGAALAIQGYNVLYYTLEDPKIEVEDRLDAVLSGIPIRDLTANVDQFRRRWRRGHRNVRAQLRIVDGTEGSYSVRQIGNELLRYRSKGFSAEAAVIDYDDEIIPRVRRDMRNQEFDQIYRDLRRLAAAHKIPVWTAAQTQRDTEGLKILAGDRVADAIGKIRKCTMALSLGKGDWGDDSIYFWVAAHKFDRQHVGCNIMPDKARMVIYDAEATWRHAREAQY